MSKNKIWIILGLIVAVGIFLRTYNFSDWLFLEADQVRDLNLVQKSLESGPGGLPLLGPKAGGTYLRLGPIFYYFQYLSGLIFGMDSPEKSAYPDLFFSILAIPLLFLFLKKFFSANWSLAMAASYAICFFAIQYSRFAWNPNSLPFFNLLFFYSLYNFFETSSYRKKILWTCVLGVVYAIASQLHFVCLFSFPVAAAAIISYRKIYMKKPVTDTIRYFPLVLLIFIIFYIPVILSDIQTSGNNLLNFLVSFGKKQSNANLSKLIAQDAYNFSKYFFIIFTGIIGASRKLYGFFFLFMATGLMAGIYLAKKLNDERKHSFITIVFAWFFSYVAVYFTLDSKVQPRHFLPILPLPFIFWGFILLYFSKIFWKYNRLAIISVLLFLPIILNAYSVKTWFNEISDSQMMVTKPRKSGLLKSTAGESWWHLKQSAQYIKGDCEEDKQKIVVVPPKHSYRSPMDYALKNAGEIRDWSISWGSMDYSPNYCYYNIHFSKNDLSDRFDWQVRKIGEETFGDMSVTRFKILPETLGEEKKIYNPFQKEKVERVDLQEIEGNEEETDMNIEADKGETDLDDETQEKNFDGLDDEKNLEEEKVEEDDGEKSDSWLILEDADREDRLFWRDLFNNK